MAPPPPSPPPPTPPPPPPPPLPDYCYYKCYGYDMMGLKTVRLFSTDNDYFSKGTCVLEQTDGYKCGAVTTGNNLVCETSTCKISPPPPSPPPALPSAPPVLSGYADAGAWDVYTWPKSQPVVQQTDGTWS